MAGLLNAEKQNPQQAPAPAAAGPEAAPNVSKEEQAQYDEFVTNDHEHDEQREGLKGAAKGDQW